MIIPVKFYTKEGVKLLAQKDRGVIGTSTDGREVNRQFRDLCYAMGSAYDLRDCLRMIYGNYGDRLPTNVVLDIGDALAKSYYKPKAGDLVLE